MATSTRGGPSCQVQNTVTRSAPEANSTRIHVSVFHTCIDQPAPGDADTSDAPSPVLSTVASRAPGWNRAVG